MKRAPTPPRAAAASGSGAKKVAPAKKPRRKKEEGGWSRPPLRHSDAREYFFFPPKLTPPPEAVAFGVIVPPRLTDAAASGPRLRSWSVLLHLERMRYNLDRERWFLQGCIAARSQGIRTSLFALVTDEWRCDLNTELTHAFRPLLYTLVEHEAALKGPKEWVEATIRHIDKYLGTRRPEYSPFHWLRQAFLETTPFVAGQLSMGAGLESLPGDSWLREVKRLSQECSDLMRGCLYALYHLLFDQGRLTCLLPLETPKLRRETLGAASLRSRDYAVCTRAHLTPPGQVQLGAEHAERVLRWLADRARFDGLKTATKKDASAASEADETPVSQEVSRRSARRAAYFMRDILPLYYGGAERGAPFGGAQLVALMYLTPPRSYVADLEVMLVWNRADPLSIGVHSVPGPKEDAAQLAMIPPAPAPLFPDAAAGATQKQLEIERLARELQHEIEQPDAEEAHKDILDTNRIIDELWEQEFGGTPFGGAAADELDLLRELPPPEIGIPSLSPPSSPSLLSPHSPFSMACIACGSRLTEAAAAESSSSQKERHVRFCGLHCSHMAAAAIRRVLRRRHAREAASAV